MTLYNANYSILIDYDNLEASKRSQGILSIVHTILDKIEHNQSFKRIKCDIRIYGGWYEKDQITASAEKIIKEVGDDFPTIKKLENISIKLDATIALATLEEPSHHLFDTFRKKSSSHNIRIKTKEDVGCTDPNCFIPSIKKVLAKGKCSKEGCQVSDYLLYRNEQKIVDTMITCDILFSNTAGFDHVIVVSSDDDFIPPIRSVALRGIPVYRFHTKESIDRKPLEVPTLKLIEMEI